MYDRLGMTRMLVRGGAPDAEEGAPATGCDGVPANAVGRGELATGSLAARSKAEPASWVMTKGRGGGSLPTCPECWRCIGGGSGIRASHIDRRPKLRVTLSLL